MNILKAYFTVLFCFAVCSAVGQKQTSISKEPHRLQIHFSPKEHWMKDPNGMVYYKGVYHLFYQYYPDDTVWIPLQNWNSSA